MLRIKYLNSPNLSNQIIGIFKIWRYKTLKIIFLNKISMTQYDMAKKTAQMNMYKKIIILPLGLLMLGWSIEIKLTVTSKCMHMVIFLRHTFISENSFSKYWFWLVLINQFFKRLVYGFTNIKSNFLANKYFKTHNCFNVLSLSNMMLLRLINYMFSLQINYLTPTWPPVHWPIGQRYSPNFHWWRLW